MSLETRRLLLRIGVGILLAGALVVLPAYLASRPGFFSTYPALADKYGPWVASTHAEAGCETCHVKPGVLPRAGYRVQMVGEFYRSLVSKGHTPRFGRPTNEACVHCHTELKAVSPEGDLQIPHKAHVNVLKMECVACHNYLVHELSPEGGHTPPMAGCLEQCHDGDKASNACSDCHLQKAAPASHSDATWLVKHAAEAANPDCVGCHQWKDDWCADCHRSRPASHGADWREAHGERVAEHRNCEVCHTGDFCSRCHGEVPQENFDPTLALVE